MSNRILQRIVWLLSLTFLLVPLAATGTWLANRDGSTGQGSLRRGGSEYLTDYVFRPIGRACGISTEGITKKLTASDPSPFFESRSLDGTVMPNEYLRGVRDARIKREWKEKASGLTNLYNTNNLFGGKQKSSSRSAKRR